VRNDPFPDPAKLFVRPDHYIFRMLYSQGVSLEDLEIGQIEKRIYSRNESLHAPHLLDLEVTQVLRHLALQGVVPVHRVDEAVRDLLDLPYYSVSSSRALAPYLATPSQFFCL
jgi:predicted nucleic acid-binding protein